MVLKGIGKIGPYKMFIIKASKVEFYKENI